MFASQRGDCTLVLPFQHQQPYSHPSHPRIAVAPRGFKTLSITPIAVSVRCLITNWPSLKCGLFRARCGHADVNQDVQSSLLKGRQTDDMDATYLGTLSIFYMADFPSCSRDLFHSATVTQYKMALGKACTVLCCAAVIVPAPQVTFPAPPPLAPMLHKQTISHQEVHTFMTVSEMEHQMCPFKF